MRSVHSHAVKAASGHIVHPFAPVFDDRSRILILGSLPSVLSRQNAFYYGNPRNRFWAVLAALTGEDVPVSVEGKRTFLLRNRIAVWDVIRECEITGSSDSSIRNAEANDIGSVLACAPIGQLFANGARAYALYRKLCFPELQRDITLLPSTSPANASFSLSGLIEAWRSVSDALR